MFLKGFDRGLFSRTFARKIKVHFQKKSILLYEVLSQIFVNFDLKRLLMAPALRKI